MSDITKRALHRGFTLIELMIVIVILGILMGTILPRLTGAQARARDTARQADLGNISQALFTYRTDVGNFPGAAIGAKYCLGQGVKTCTAQGSCAADTTVDDALKPYLKGNAIPMPPQGDQENRFSSNAGDDCWGGYVYVPLKNKTIDFNGFILASDMENYQNANYIAGSVTIDTNTDLTKHITAPAAGSKILTKSTADLASLKTVDTTTQLNTVFVVAGE